MTPSPASTTRSSRWSAGSSRASSLDRCWIGSKASRTSCVTSRSAWATRRSSPTRASSPISAVGSSSLRRSSPWPSGCGRVRRHCRVQGDAVGDRGRRAREMRAEIERLEAQVITDEEQLRVLLLPPDPNDGRNVILEIRVRPVARRRTSSPRISSTCSSRSRSVRAGAWRSCRRRTAISAASVR